MAKTKMKNEGLEPKREQTRKFKEKRPNSLGNWASQNSAWVGRDENRVKTTVVGTTDMANIDMKNEGLGPEREHTRKTEGNDSIS